MKNWAQKRNNVLYIDPNDALCKGDRCLVQDEKGEPIYSDKGHLSKYGAKIVGEYIFKKIAINSNK